VKEGKVVAKAKNLNELAEKLRKANTLLLKLWR